MATITEDYVSFETAKLLRDKGFPQDPNICNTAYTTKGKLSNNAKSFVFNYELIIPRVCYIAPTLQMAMKWLREVHKLYVEVVPNPFNFEHQDIQDGWGCEVTHLSDLSYDGNYEFFQKKYSTYEEACEAAIKYCLESLI